MRRPLRALAPEGVIVCLLVALHWGYLSFPPEDPDVGGITYNAMLINRGMVPYRDTFEQKLPGAFFIVAAWLRVVGETVVGLNVAALAWTTVHLIVLMWGVRRLWGAAPARWAGVAFALAFTAPVVSGRCPNYELWMTMPITWSLLLLSAVPGAGRWTLAFAGFLAAAGVMVKQQAAFSCLPVLVWAFTRVRADRMRGAKEVAALACGAVVCVAPLVAFFAAHGEWGTFLRMIDPRGATTYAAGGGAPSALIWRIARQETMRVVREMPLLYYAGTALLATIAWHLTRPRLGAPPAAMLIAWIIGSAMGVGAGMRFYTHYYVQLIPPLSVAVGWLASQMRPSLRGGAREAAAAFLLIATMAWPSLGKVTGDARMAWFQTKYVALGRTMPKVPPVQLAAHIRAVTPHDGPILVWGHAEDIYFLANRLAPTRYYKYFGFLSPPPTTWGPPTLNPLAAPHAERFLREIAARPPSAIVVSTAPGDAPPTVLPGFERFLASYRPERSFGELQLWLPRDGANGSPQTP